MIDHIVYDSFGNVTYESSPSNGDRFKFAGMAYDTTTSLYFDMARYYNPATGRFVQQIPKASLQGIAISTDTSITHQRIIPIRPVRMQRVPRAALSVAWLAGRWLGLQWQGRSAHLSEEGLSVRRLVLRELLHERLRRRVRLWRGNRDRVGRCRRRQITYYFAIAGYSGGSCSISLAPAGFTVEGAVAGSGAAAAARAGSQQATKITGCFAAGTPLRTPDGSKSIESFQERDLLLSRHEDDPEGPVIAKRVLKVIQSYAPLLDLHVGGRVIRTTAEHPFWVAGRGWIGRSRSYRATGCSAPTARRRW